MIPRLVVVAAGVVAAAAGAAAWARRRASRDAGTAGRRPDETAAGRRSPTSASATRTGAGAERDGATPSGDDLQVIKGIGAVSAERLSSIGVTTYAEIASWTAQDVERVAAEISVSAARIRREDWVGQAQAISQG